MSRLRQAAEVERVLSRSLLLDNLDDLGRRSDVREICSTHSLALLPGSRGAETLDDSPHALQTDALLLDQLILLPEEHCCGLVGEPRQLGLRLPRDLQPSLGSHSSSHLSQRGY